ncbi:MAG: winged helix-turn-helix transcriptional regulator [Candidatus Aenigmarchaeota archaeon]|nr:winged helix-turn-helix transcriptional regulator [Candidatus Aenigmarchaeota archaeon]
MSYTVIAPVGDNLKHAFVGMKEFPTEKFMLISPSNKLKNAQDLKNKLEEFTIKSEIIQINDNIMEEMFRVFGKICSLYKNDDLLVNIATGDSISTCAALSAAFANGLKAFGVMDNKVMLLPIMKLSYYNELTESKMKILRCLDAEDYLSLKELSEKTKMSISLLSYHINGNYKHRGLKEFRLVDIKEKKKILFVKLSKMGYILLKGYIKPNDKK